MRFSKEFFGWVGFHYKMNKGIPKRGRAAGETNGLFGKLFSNYSLEGITGFSVAPLSLASVMGVGFCALAFYYDCSNHRADII